jgi:TatD DNase family protein
LKPLVTVDCHAHLDDKFSLPFLDSLRAIENLNTGRSPMWLFSNSVDLDSSNANLLLAEEFPKSVVPFVGIHPQSAKSIFSKRRSDEINDRLRNKLDGLVQQAKGIGEVGLDPKYGDMELQVQLFEMQLQIAEKHSSLPITFHSRETISQIIDLISAFKLSNRMLFHWFAGTEAELAKLRDLGTYVSFGPSLLFSKRMSNLASIADNNLILSETDSPLMLGSLEDHKIVSPFIVTSVLLQMAQIRKSSFQEISDTIYRNSVAYIQAQNSLSLISK